ncbi:hypothetical protein IPM62_05505 [Candidatus Woesebacteria bacterium]|nr:MAG: hypothetical protein IPM62_05505 [Candidatus Woesebacteria bacterium]
MDNLEKTEYLLRKIILVSALLITVYFVYLSINDGLFAPENVPTKEGGFSGYQFGSEHYINLYRGIRNIVYIPLLGYLLLVSYLAHKRRDKKKIKRYIWRVFGLWLLLTVSYALAGLVVDLTVVWLALVHINP